MTSNQLDLTADIIDVRDIIARLEAHLDDFDLDPKLLSKNDRDEMALLQAILADLAGNGGDEQWRGDWYPVTLIRESYFADYCQDLVIDCGGLPASIPDYLVIDWEATSRNLKVDYSEVEIDGVTFFYR